MLASFKGVRPLTLNFESTRCRSRLQLPIAHEDIHASYSVTNGHTSIGPVLIRTLDGQVFIFLTVITVTEKVVPDCLLRYP